VLICFDAGFEKKNNQMQKNKIPLIINTLDISFHKIAFLGLFFTVFPSDKCRDYIGEPILIADLDQFL
jgi:hypothetical protein